MSTLTRAREPAPSSQGAAGAPGRSRTAFMVGVPLAWGLLLLFHPTGEGDEFYPILRDQVTPWVVVHLGTLVALPAMAVVLHQLVRGVHGVAARTSRIAAAVFALVFTAWEVVIGVGTGILVAAVNDLPAAERATGAALVEDYTGSGVLQVLEYVGSAAWLVAVVAAAVALRRAVGLGAGAIALLVVSAPLVTAHVPPFGPVGLALFIAGVLLVARSRTQEGAPGAPLVT